MQLTEYSDDELLQEVKHRGFEIKVNLYYQEITIGGVTFDL